MRTTLSIDDDVLLAVRERARRDRRSVGAVLSDLARQALAGPRQGEGESFYGFIPFTGGGRPVTNELVNRLREEEGE